MAAALALFVSVFVFTLIVALRYLVVSGAFAWLN